MEFDIPSEKRAIGVPVADGRSEHRHRIKPLSALVYDQLIKHATQYNEACEPSPQDGPKTDQTAKVAYTVIRLSKGNVRLRLNILADKLGTDGRTMRDAFRRLFRVAPKTYQIRIRTQWACHALRSEPGRKIDSIAADIGYTDIADFNHLIHRHTGLSPREYQQLHQDSAQSAAFDK